MYDEKWLEDAMRSIQYLRVDVFAYRATWSTTTVEHFVQFGVDSRGYFDGWYGLRSPISEDFGVKSTIKYSKIDKKLVLSERRSEFACSMSFAFGALDGFSQTLWKRVPIQNGLGQDKVDRIAPFICRYVFPIIRHVVDLEAFLEFLVADKPPTIWFVTNPSVRAAQIVAVARRLGRGRYEILEYLRPFERIIAIDLSGRPADPREKFVGSLERYVDSLIGDLAEFHESAPK